MRFFEQYKNLGKEIYVLFFGRIVTSMGSLIWPLLTLILKNKLGYSASEIAVITMVLSLLQLPMLILGGKVADKWNRKYIIIVCDLITVASYIICGILPLTRYSILIFFTASVFATVEGPSYDALVADLCDSESRERVYSLQYLGMNLGLVLAPMLGGLLFENHLGLAFIITGLATLSSTLLIVFFVKKLSVEKEHVSEYEEKRENTSVFTILWERKILVLFALEGALAGVVYAQFNYLLPLNMEALYGAKGATIFGFMTSVNAFVVIACTPLITTIFGRLMDVRKMFVGEILIILGLFSYRFVQGMIPMYFVLMIIFTIGEIFVTVGSKPYMTRRIPSTHWGRLNSFINILSGTFLVLGNLMIGNIVDNGSIDQAWLAVGLAGAGTMLLLTWLCVQDPKRFPLLYESENR